jgi:hypothetical protein
MRVGLQRRRGLAATVGTPLLALLPKSWPARESGGMMRRCARCCNRFHPWRRPS